MPLVLPGRRENGACGAYLLPSAHCRKHKDERHYEQRNQAGGYVDVARFAEITLAPRGFVLVSAPRNARARNPEAAISLPSSGNADVSPAPAHGEAHTRT